MSRPLRWLIATLIFIAVLVWVEYELGWGTVLHSWRDVSLASIALLTLLTLGSYLVRSYRVFYYFGKPAGHPFINYVRINFLHNALNNFLPMRLGEASFPLMMKRQFNASLIDTSAGLLWIRLMDLHFLLLLLTLVGVAQLGPSWWYLTAVAIIGPLVAFKLVPLLLRKLPPKLQTLVLKLENSTPGSWSRGCTIYALTTLTWSIKLVALTVVMLAFIELETQQALLAVISADLSSVLPIHGLAGSGTFEAAMLAALAPFQLETETVLLAAVNVHIYLLLVTLLSVPLAFMLPVQRINA